MPINKRWFGFILESYRVHIKLYKRIIINKVKYNAYPSAVLFYKHLK